MNKQYLLKRGLWCVDKSHLVSRSGDYFNRLGDDVQTNVNMLISSVPKERRCFASQDAVQTFQLGDSGWPMSDITLLLKAQTDDQINNVLNRLVDLKSGNNIPDGTSDSDIIRDYIVPRYVGTSSEYLTYLTNKYETSVTSADLQVLDGSKVDIQSVDESSSAE